MDKKVSVMVDLETLSTMPNAAVISIGAVAFTSEGLLPNEFYVNVDPNDCNAYGLHVSADTVAWWSRQSDQAKKALETDQRLLYDALVLFNSWVKEVKGYYLYGNGADFDNPILKSCFQAIDADLPFKPCAGRCYRTIKNIPGMPAIDRSKGIHHNALDDARNQALHLIEMNKIIQVIE